MNRCVDRRKNPSPVRVSNKRGTAHSLHLILSFHYFVDGRLQATRVELVHILIENCVLRICPGGLRLRQSSCCLVLPIICIREAAVTFRLWSIFREFLDFTEIICLIRTSISLCFVLWGLWTDYPVALDPRKASLILLRTTMQKLWLPWSHLGYFGTLNSSDLVLSDVSDAVNRKGLA